MSILENAMQSENKAFISTECEECPHKREARHLFFHIANLASCMLATCSLEKTWQESDPFRSRKACILLFSVHASSKRDDRSIRSDVNSSGKRDSENKCTASAAGMAFVLRCMFTPRCVYTPRHKLLADCADDFRWLQF